MAEIISWYRRYRPTDFAELVGQDHVRRTIMGAIKAGQISHAYLFCGPRGTGKTTLARLLAKALVCMRPTADGLPCGSCDRCQEVGSSRLVDVLEIDAASNRGIDEIRDLREKIAFSPTLAKKKVYIIDEVHMLTKEAFNALLKILEEPPAHAHFILATTEAHKVPVTIISRCQRFDFRRLAEKEIKARLQFIAQAEGLQAEAEALALIAQLAEGSLRDAIALLEQLSYDRKLSLADVKSGAGLVDESLVRRWQELVAAGELAPALNFVEELYQDGVNLPQFTQAVVLTLRTELLRQLAKRQEELARTTWRQIKALMVASQNFRTALVPQLPLEEAVITVITVAPHSRSEEPVVEKAVGKAPALESVATQIPSLTSVLERWPTVLSKLKLATARFSLATAGVQAVLSDGGLRIAIDSAFKQQQLERSQEKHDLATALQQVFGRVCPVELVVEKGEAPLGALVAVASRAATASPADQADLARRVTNIFGGEAL